MVSRSQNSGSNEITEDRRSTPSLLSLNRQKKTKVATCRNGDTTETNNVSEGEGPKNSGTSGAKRKRNNNYAATLNEDSDIENATPSTHDKCVQSGKGKTGRTRNVSNICSNSSFGIQR